MADESFGLLSWSSRCRILCRSVSVLWDAGHWGAGVGFGGWGNDVLWMLLLDSVPVSLLSWNWLGLGLPICEAEEKGAFTESSSPSSPPSEGFADGGLVEELVGVLVCRWWTGDDRTDPDGLLVALQVPSPPECCLLRLLPLFSPPAGEWRPGVEGEKGFPVIRGLPPNPGPACGILDDINEVGVAVSGLLRGEGLLSCWGQVRLGIR